MESNQNSLERYQRTQMRKENIIEKLRERAAGLQSSGRFCWMLF